MRNAIITEIIILLVIPNFIANILRVISKGLALTILYIDTPQLNLLDINA